MLLPLLLIFGLTTMHAKMATGFQPPQLFSTILNYPPLPPPRDTSDCVYGNWTKWEPDHFAYNQECPGSKSVVSVRKRQADMPPPNKHCMELEELNNTCLPRVETQIEILERALGTTIDGEILRDAPPRPPPAPPIRHQPIPLLTLPRPLPTASPGSNLNPGFGSGAFGGGFGGHGSGAGSGLPPPIRSGRSIDSLISGSDGPSDPIVRLGGDDSLPVLVDIDGSKLPDQITPGTPDKSPQVSTLSATAHRDLPTTSTSGHSTQSAVTTNVQVTVRPDVPTEDVPIPQLPELHKELPSPPNLEANARDIALVVDASGSVGRRNFFKAIRSIASILGMLCYKWGKPGQPSDVRLALVVYSGQAEVVYDFVDSRRIHTSATAIRNSILAVQRIYDRMGGATGTAPALRRCYDDVFKTERGMRENSQKRLILLTDGESNTGGSPVRIAAKLHERDNVDIYPIGIGAGINLAELNSLKFFASKDSLLSTLLVLPDFTSLKQVVRSAQRNVRRKGQCHANLVRK